MVDENPLDVVDCYNLQWMRQLWGQNQRGLREQS